MSDSGGSVSVVLTTAPDASEADRLATELVTGGFAACATILPGATSVYRWEGELQKDGESVLLIKVASDRADALRRRLVELHPYDVPECLVLPVTDGFPPYLSWVVSESAGA